MAAASDPADVYESAACGLLTLAIDGTIERVNATFCAWLGWKATELIGQRRFQELLTIGSKLFHQTHWMPLLQLQGSVAEVQLDLVHREGRTLSALVNAALHARSNGGISGGASAGSLQVAVFIATDRRKYERELLLARRRAEELLVSERDAQQGRALAEERLRLALDSANLHAWSVELPSGVISYERQVGTLLGRPELLQVPAEMYAEAIHVADREPERLAFEDAIDPAQRALYSTEYRLLGLDGLERLIHATGRAFFDATGKAVGFSGVLQDVTARRRAEQDAQKRAVFAEQLVGIVSHDLRNPLNAVLLGTHLLQATELTPDRVRVVKRIASSVERANRLVADLLDFTQARLGGGLPINSREVDLHAIVLECVEEVRLAWPGRMIEVRTNGSGPTQLDPDRLAQVISNLTNNALTYGVPEQPVTITSTISDRGVQLRVHNAGRPIDSELLPHLFEPLRRGEQSVKLGSRSIGLGLYIVHEIAAAHHGRVSVTSTEANGTSFVVSLPRLPVSIS